MMALTQENVHYTLNNEQTSRTGFMRGSRNFCQGGGGGGLYFCYDSSDPVGPSMIPIKTIVIEQVRRDISSVKQAYVKLACNRVISPGISHIACESVETAIRTFMFGCLFSIFHHAIKYVSLIENTDQTFSL